MKMQVERELCECEYDRIRLNNIKEKMELLEALGFGPEKEAPKRTKKKRAVMTEPVKVRRSSRLNK